MNDQKQKNQQIVLMAEVFGCEPEFATQLMTICAVSTPDQLYAKYIAVGKTDTLFAKAVGISTEEWANLIERVRDFLPSERVAELEKPLTDNELFPLGYTPREHAPETQAETETKTEAETETEAELKTETEPELEIPDDASSAENESSREIEK